MAVNWWLDRQAAATSNTFLPPHAQDPEPQYPCCLSAGELSSDDDFYLLDTGLAVLQTTNNILDTSLYRLLTPATLTSWQRVRAANMLSATGAAAWCALACRVHIAKAGGSMVQSMLL
jgi:Phospholipase B